MGQPRPALACSSSANEGFGYDLSGHGRDSEEQGALQNLLLVAQWELVPTIPWTLAWEGQGGGGGGCSFVEPTPRNVPELGKTVGASALSRGREAALPSAERGRGSVQTLHNHYLGNAWHEENGVALSDPLCSSPGVGSSRPCWSFCLQPSAWGQEYFSLCSCLGNSPRL